MVENLNLAFARNSKFREGWFTKDRSFDGLRAEILKRIPAQPVIR